MTFYTLLDSGNGRKLEQMGTVVTDRPEPQALWPKALPDNAWAAAHAVFNAEDDDGDGNGRWNIAPNTPSTWPVAWDGLPFHARLTAFRHLGCFPDQALHWEYLKTHLKPGMKLLNLFGYSGVATLVAARAGAEVVHVDASKKAIGYGRENAELAGLDKKPIRWICDDALTFMKREVRRGNQYHGIILDPPKYGRGPDGEKWEFFANMPALLETLAPLTINAQGSFGILTAYALRASAEAMASSLAEAYKPLQGHTTHGTLTCTDAANRSFATALWARWEK
ncbi:MAG: class I SAM-dependent methyltransferase [Alphaproteobacteria bacterium]